MLKIIREERFLGAGLATSLVFLMFGGWLHSDYSSPLYLALILAWLFFVILGSVLAVVRHADQLAERLGEPYGTLILTLSVTAIEAMSISAVMLHGANNPTLVRDTLMAVIMIILNGMVGLSLLAGGWRHREQHYNLQGANAYLSVIIPLAVLGLVLPNVTQATQGQLGGTGQLGGPGPTIRVGRDRYPQTSCASSSSAPALANMPCSGHCDVTRRSPTCMLRPGTPAPAHSHKRTRST